MVNNYGERFTFSRLKKESNDGHLVGILLLPLLEYAGTQAIIINFSSVSSIQYMLYLLV